MALKENYKDDILDISQNVRRKYQMIDNGDGTVSFEDVTEYTQQGDSFGASDINAITEAVNRNSGMPVGTIATFDGTTLPSGFEPYQTEEQRAIAQINDNLTEKVTKFSGTDSGNTYVTVDGLAYDATNKKLGLKVNGADTVVPFSTGCSFFGVSDWIFKSNNSIRQTAAASYAGYNLLVITQLNRTYDSRVTMNGVSMSAITIGGGSGIHEAGYKLYSNLQATDVLLCSNNDFPYLFLYSKNPYEIIHLTAGQTRELPTHSKWFVFLGVTHNLYRARFTLDGNTLTGWTDVAASDNVGLCFKDITSLVHEGSVVSETSDGHGALVVGFDL